MSYHVVCRECADCETVVDDEVAAVTRMDEHYRETGHEVEYAEVDPCT